jgi:hypothetical protein
MKAKTFLSWTCTVVNDEPRENVDGGRPSVSVLMTKGKKTRWINPIVPPSWKKHDVHWLCRVIIEQDETGRYHIMRHADGRE